MDCPDKGTAPNEGLLIDFTSDCPSDNAQGGYEFSMGPGGDFNAELAIFELFGKPLASSPPPPPQPPAKAVVQQQQPPLGSSSPSDNQDKSRQKTFLTGGFEINAPAATTIYRGDVVPNWGRFTAPVNTTTNITTPLLNGRVVGPQVGRPRGFSSPSPRGFPRSFMNQHHIEPAPLYQPSWPLRNGRFPPCPAGFVGFKDEYPRDTNNNGVEKMDSGFGRSNAEIARISSRSGKSSRARRRRGGGGGDSHRGGGINDSPRHAPTNDNFPMRAASPQPMLPNKEESPQPTEFGSKRPVNAANDFLTSPRGTPSKRRRMLCEKCGRYGHAAEVCFSITHASLLRCYNCRKIGHLAVRCQMKPRTERPPDRRRVTSSTGASAFNDNRTNSSTESSAASNSGQPSRGAEKAKNELPTEIELQRMGVTIIRQLMEDPQMRKEAMRRTPELYEEMITLMMQHVKI